MPFYRFQIDSPLTPETVLLRLRRLVRDWPRFGELVDELFDSSVEQGRPFIGTFDGASFKIQASAYSRNAFVPHMRGSVVAIPGGARVLVTMQVHAGIVGFMLLWLGALGLATVAAFLTPGLLLAGVLIGVAFVLWGFYPDALQARRVIEDAVLGPR